LNSCIPVTGPLKLKRLEGQGKKYKAKRRKYQQGAEGDTKTKKVSKKKMG